MTITLNQILQKMLQKLLIALDGVITYKYPFVKLPPQNYEDSIFLFCHFMKKMEFLRT